MTTAIIDRMDVQVTVRARDAALAWLNVFLATGDDEHRPLLSQTLCFEWFEGGVQLIATDGTIMLRGWIPAVVEDVDNAIWPEKDEAPLRSLIVMDPDGFGVGFIRTLLRMTKDEERQYETLTITSAPHDDEANLLLGSEFMTERLTLRACGQRIDLRLYDDKYPDWRRVQLGAEDMERVETLTVSPRLLGIVGRIKGASAVDCDFHGDAKQIAVRVRGECEVRGLIMPMRREPTREL